MCADSSLMAFRLLIEMMQSLYYVVILVTLLAEVLFLLLCNFTHPEWAVSRGNRTVMKFRSRARTGYKHPISMCAYQKIASGPREREWTDKFYHNPLICQTIYFYFVLAMRLYHIPLMCEVR
jgi:hypothetical protein